MDTVELRTTHMVVGGAALARERSGRVVFVDGALSGETVVAALRTAKRDYATADVTEVIDASPHRVVPPCDAWHRGCGGCDWQHIAPAAQLGLKTSIVREALTRTAKLIEPHVVAGGSVAPWGYRTTVRVASAGGVVGFRSRRSHQLVAVDHCPVAATGINEFLAEIGEHPPGDDADITVRVSQLDGTRNDSIGGVSGASLNEVVAGHRFQVSLDSFFQSSPLAAELLVEAVARALGDVDLERSVVVDAYGGVGLFAATVAATAHRLVLIEASPSACADARINLAGRRASVVQARVEDWLPEPADVVIADPARTGLDSPAARALAATQATVLVLVSCDTGSLARDAKLLLGHGYEHDGTEVIDAFPNTSHIETVTRFVRNGPQSSMGVG